MTCKYIGQRITTAWTCPGTGTWRSSNGDQKYQAYREQDLFKQASEVGNSILRDKIIETYLEMGLEVM